MRLFSRQRLRLVAFMVANLLAATTGWDHTQYPTRFPTSAGAGGVLIFAWLLGQMSYPTDSMDDSLFTVNESPILQTQPMSLSADGQSIEDLTTLTQQYGPWCGHTALR